MSCVVLVCIQSCMYTACTWQGQNCSCTFQEVKCLSDLKTVLGRTRKSNIHCTLHGAYATATTTIHLFMCMPSVRSAFALPHLHIKLLCQFGAWVAFYGFQALVKMFIAKSLTTSACEQQNLQSLKHCSKNKKLMCIW